jgi:acetolactate synthase-1/2/3 large subunit
MMHTLTGAELMVALLENQGVTHIAGIPGGAILPFYDALARRGTITHILARHEQGAGFIAQGMARATGQPAVCVASSGPGATNLLTAIADAHLDSVPLVAITGQVPLAMIGTDAFQEVDIYGMSIPVTKHNFLVRSAAELLTVIPEAFRLAQSGRPGPVLIDVPKDVQLQQVSFAAWPEPGTRDTGPALDLAAIAAAAELIDAAERPVLYLGGGVVAAGAAPLARALAEQAAIPTVMTLMGLGAMPSDHPLSLGMLGMHGARFTNFAVQESDLLLVVGARLDDRAVGKASAFAPHARLIHIDIDRAELGKIKTPFLAIHADVKEALAALLPRVRPQMRKRWLAHVAALKARFPMAMPGRDDIAQHYGLIQAVAEQLDDSAVVVTDVGQHQMWVAQAYPLCRPRQWLTSGGLGTMGFGLPAAIGAALAQPQRTVVLFTGDGSLQMNLQELATLAEWQANVKVVLMDNHTLGLVYQQQNLFYGQRAIASYYTHHVDFVTVARGFGLPAFDLTQTADPRRLLAEALGRPGPVVIRCPIDAQAFVYPMVPPGAANNEMIEAGGVVQ